METLFARQEHPYTADLLRAMPRMDEHGHDRLPAIPGTPPDPAALPSGCAFHPRCRLAEDQCRSMVPALLPRTVEGQSAACWVTERGAAIPVLDRESAGVRDRPRPDRTPPLS
ncbi:peptide ABC transporter ATP-binding protein, partial [Streptomyces sp. TRM76130]|nr:peptide ABC transporter ATP-binding protein [Streptomyces sp. TRM76130]